MRPTFQDFSVTYRTETNEQPPPRSAIHLLDASKPPEGAGAPLAGSGTAAAAAAAEAGRGAVGDGRVPRVSKPVSSRSFCTGAGVRDGAAVGARVGDISPERGATHFTVTLIFAVHSSRCVSVCGRFAHSDVNDAADEVH